MKLKQLDPRDPSSKKQIKASIIDALVKEIAGSNREEIALRVETQYERLLLGAAVLTMIPSLTAGNVRREMKALAVLR